MPSHQLAVTEHFSIEWFSGADHGGLYVFQNAGEYSLRSGGGQVWKDYDPYLTGPQFFVDLSLVPRLIAELKAAETAITVLSRTSYSFVPTLHRVPKKDGGSPGAAYYEPLEVAGEQRQELAGGLEKACSQENVKQHEEKNPSESYYVLDSDYLMDRIWASSVRYPELRGGQKEIVEIEVPPATLPQAPKVRSRPPMSTEYGRGATLLRTARTRHQCSARRCIDYVWIKPGQQYIEHRHGSYTERYHVKCAFRCKQIPENWLNPHFEQYHTLVEIGFKGWIEQEKQKMTEYDDEIFKVPSDVAKVQWLVEQVKSGYHLDQYEREEWRDHLRYTPVDLEPYQTARELVGLTGPVLPTREK